MDDNQLADERARLVRFCAHLTGCPDDADDLAQETLIEAWRHPDRLARAQSQPAWLTGIARNVCRRWHRAQALERSRRDRPRPRANGEPEGAPAHSGIEAIPDTADTIADALGRIATRELGDVLLHHLAALPARTRGMMLCRYGEGQSHADIAARFRISETAVAVALHRGTRQLREGLLMGSESRPVLADWGIDALESQGWVQTRTWCIRCGGQRLLGRFDREAGDVGFRCPICHRDGTHSLRHRSPALFTGISGYKPALNRLLSFWHEAWVRGRQDGLTTCDRCGSQAVYRIGMPENGPLRHEPGAHFACPRCGPVLDMTIGGLVKTMPQGRRFWTTHVRVRTLPERSIERHGREATVVRLESVAGSAWLDVMFAPETCAPVEVHGSPGG